MTKEEAVVEIIEKVLLLAPKAPDETVVNFHAEKLVLEILDYCHRKDFPEALIYDTAELIQGKLALNDYSREEMSLPIKSIRQNDTEFTFAVKDVENGVTINTDKLEHLKPKLNRYRKVQSL